MELISVIVVAVMVVGLVLGAPDSLVKRVTDRLNHLSVSSEEAQEPVGEIRVFDLKAMKASPRKTQEPSAKSLT